jgi:dihydroorotase
LGLNAGNLAIGSPADICIFDADAEWTLDAEQLYSKGRNTPFQGWALRGRVHYTLVGGDTAYQLSKNGGRRA